jgi:hypothetical protein
MPRTKSPPKEYVVVHRSLCRTAWEAEGWVSTYPTILEEAREIKKSLELHGRHCLGPTLERHYRTIGPPETFAADDPIPGAEW